MGPIRDKNQGYYEPAVVKWQWKHVVTNYTIDFAICCCWEYKFINRNLDDGMP